MLDGKTTRVLMIFYKLYIGDENSYLFTDERQ